jgi:shikimate kinase
MKSQSVILIGFMGCGKSSVARELSTLMKLPASDLDTKIEQAAGKTVPQIFAEDGEEAFRALETETLKAVLRESGIIATGGGVPTRAENRALLAKSNALVVYLRTAPRTLATRIRQQPGSRPLIDAGQVLSFKETLYVVEDLLARRETFYHECATMVIDTDKLSPRQVAQQIVR